MPNETSAMRVLVTGASGMLGRAVARAAPPRVSALESGREDGDLSVAAAAERLLAGGVGGVLHCAGFSGVDAAEEREAEAFRDNETATRRVAEACARLGIPLVVVSSDYVFDGETERPYREDDPPRPINAYGRSKLAAERAALEAHPQGTRIVRTQWLYGPFGRHFPGRILELAREQPEIRVVADQIGCPTSTLELAPVLWDVLLRAPPGIYHAACEGRCSWFELAAATLEIAGVRGVRVLPCTTEEMPRPAARPRFSALDCSKLAALRGRRLAPWRDALVRYLAREAS